MAYHTPLTVQDARQQLLAPPATGLTVMDARAELLAPPSAPLTVADAKRQLLQADIGKISLADSKRNLLAIKTQEKLARLTPAQPGQAPLLSNAEADTVLGGAANMVLGGIGGAATVVGGIINTVPILGNLIDSLGIEPAEYEIANTINQKLSVNDALSEGELAYYEQEKDGNLAAIANIQKKSEFINAIKVGVESVNSWQNTAKQAVATEQVKEAAGIAANEFSSGEYVAGFATIVSGIYNMATDNPVAAMEFTANSLPQMLALAWKAVPAVTTLALATAETALQDFKAEYGREATAGERGIAVLASFAYAGTDMIGAKFALGGIKLLEVLPKATAAMGMKMPSSLLKATGAAVAKATGSTIGKLTKPISVAGVEGTTEGIQNLLEQYAAKQDLSKLSGTEALTDTIIGAVSGAQLATPTAAGTLGKVTKDKLAPTVDKTRKTVNKAAGSIVNKANLAGVGKTVNLIKAAKEANEPIKGMDSIRRAAFNDVSIKEQEGYIDSYFDFLDTLAEQVATSQSPELKDKLDQYSKDVGGLIDVVEANRNKAPVTTSVNTLRNEKASEEAQTAAVGSIANTAQSSATLPKAIIDEVLGSDSKFRELATSAQVRVVEDLQDLETKRSKLGEVTQSMEGVAEDIENGTGKFPGISAQLKKVKVAIYRKDAKAIAQVIESIAELIEAQTAKLDPTKPAGQFKNSRTGKMVPHVTALTNRIKHEISTLEATLVQVDNMVAAKPIKKTAPIKDTKTPTATEAKPEVAKESIKKGKQKSKNKSKQPTIKDMFTLDSKGTAAGTKENFKAILAKVLKGKTNKEKVILRAEYITYRDQVVASRKLDKELAITLLEEALKNTTITREDGDKEIEFNALQELVTLNNRLDGLKDIWNTCR